MTYFDRPILSLNFDVVTVVFAALGLLAANLMLGRSLWPQRLDDHSATLCVLAARLTVGYLIVVHKTGKPKVNARFRDD